MKKRIIATTTMLSLLLAMFMFAPGGIATAEETINPLDDQPAGDTTQDQDPPPNTAPLLAEGEGDNIVVIGAPSNNPVNPYDGGVTTLRLSFVNTGAHRIRNISVTLSGFRPGISLASGQAFTIDLGADRIVERGGSFNVQYNLVVSGNVGTGDHVFDFQVMYDVIDADGNVFTPHGANQTSTGSTFISIIRPVPPPPEPEPDPPPPPTPIPPSVPRVIISHQQLSVDSVVAGSPFDLTITLLNTSRNRNVRNMVVTITDAEGVFVPVVGVNSFFIERLDSQETAEIVISLLARQDTETGSHPITVRIDYEDTQNAPHSTAPTINIPVYMPVRLETRSLSFEDEGGGSAFLSFQIINLSRAPLYNVGVRLEGPFMAEQFQEFHFGTINAGAFDFFEDTIFPFEFGEVSGEIVLIFEDSSGAEGEIRIPISTWIGEPFFPEFPGEGERWPPDGEFPWEEETVNGEGIPWWLWAAIGGGVLLAGIITIVIVRRVKRKKKEAEDFDDE